MNMTFKQRGVLTQALAVGEVGDDGCWVLLLLCDPLPLLDGGDALLLCEPVLGLPYSWPIALVTTNNITPTRYILPLWGGTSHC